jgi:chitodextrinase
MSKTSMRYLWVVVPAALLILGVTVGQTQIDTEPPTGSVVINSGAVATNSTSVTLTMSATDGQGAVSTMRFSNTGTSFSVAEAFSSSKRWTLSSGSGSKTVYAQFADTAGNWSGSFSDAIMLDTVAPTISGVSASNISQTGATISWATNEPSSSQVQYGKSTSYGLTTAVDAALVPSHTVTLTGLASQTRYNYRVRSRDAAGNEKVGSNYTFTTLAAPDVTPPTVPSGLATAAASPTQASLSWNASTDNVGVTAYLVRRGETLIASTAARTYADTGLQPETAYAYSVAAQDKAGNTSAFSAPVSVTTPARDVTPPTAVLTLTVTACNDHACTLSWVAPGDDGNAGTATAYDIRYAMAAISSDSNWATAVQTAGEPVPAPAGTQQGFTVSGLTPSTTYFFALTTSDEAGNIGALSNTPTGTTLEASPSSAFTFGVYGDSAANDSCANNSDHMKIVSQLTALNPELVIHLGDSITGFTNTTNWTQRGGCPNAASTGSLREIISPLVNRPAPAGLPTSFFPVIGNHDDDWRDNWYPDPFGQGICDAYGASLIRSLVPNHTQQTYFRDKTGRNYPIMSDTVFYQALCGKTFSTSMYGDFFYYSFDYKNAHFVVMHVNSDYFDLRASNASCPASAESNYETCYNIHQLHWLQADLAKAKANPDIRHIFGFMHAPSFTSADGHPANASWKYISQEFSKVNADMIFSGHNHVYERTVPIYATSALPNGVRDDQLGTVYIESGGGGQPLSGLRTAAWFDAARSNTKHHVEVTVNGDQVFVKAVDLNGSVIDNFTCSSCGQ